MIISTETPGKGYLGLDNEDIIKSNLCEGVACPGLRSMTFQEKLFKLQTPILLPFCNIKPFAEVSEELSTV